MKPKKTRWSRLKNLWLKWTRGASFRDILESKFVGEQAHPNKVHQKLLFYEYQSKVWVIPYVETEKVKFLKTFYSSTKYTRKYKRGEL